MKRAAVRTSCLFCVLALLGADALRPITASPVADGVPQDADTVAPKTRLNGLPRASKPTLSDFAWLEGKWQGTWGPRIAEQVWTAPRAGQMLGLFRAVENDKTVVIELFSLVETPDGIELRLRHFTPALVPWEQSTISTLQLAGLDAKAAVFENAADGQPKRDIFTRIDPDTYALKSDIAREAGPAHATEIRYHRQR